MPYRRVKQSSSQPFIFEQTHTAVEQHLTDDFNLFHDEKKMTAHPSQAL